MNVHEVRADELDEELIAALSEILVDCVEGGASVNFMWPFTDAEAAVFWRKVAAGVADGRVRLLVAEGGTAIDGTVQLHLDTPPNQPHRAEVAKLLVHRRARCQGFGAALMRAVEAVAAECGRDLLVLDTASSDAERIYRARGWTALGRIPRYALMPDGAPCATTIFYKDLAAAEATA